MMLSKNRMNTLEKSPAEFSSSAVPFFYLYVATVKHFSTYPKRIKIYWRARGKKQSETTW